MSLSNVPKVFNAEKTFQISCEVFGAQPEPDIIWNLDKKTLDALPTQQDSESNLYTSELIYTPKIGDDGKNLTCTAETQYFQKKYKSVTMNVQYVPIVSVHLDEELYQNNKIREHQDLALECSVQASPPAHRILWYFNGEEIVSSEKTILSNRRLELRDVTKLQTGSYVCSASNVVGDGFSEPFSLSVNYKPVN